MEHKAYLLDYDRFTAELGPVLYRALAGGDTGQLKRFIDRNRDRLTDPAKGEKLAADWAGPLESRDAFDPGRMGSYGRGLYVTFWPHERWN